MAGVPDSIDRCRRIRRETEGAERDGEVLPCMLSATVQHLDSTQGQRRQTVLVGQEHESLSGFGILKNKDP